jgi:hypothetical protein
MACGGDPVSQVDGIDLTASYGKFMRVYKNTQLPFPFAQPAPCFILMMS